MMGTGDTLLQKLNDFAQAVASFEERRRRIFYETLAHNLTVCTRGIWSDELLSDAAKVEQMKWLNEIQHQVINKLRATTPSPDGEFFEGVLRARTDACPELRGLVASAVKHSYEYASVQPVR